MNPVAQSYPNMVAVVRIYFYSLVIFDALVLLNLCIAVMSFAFQRIRESAKTFEPEVRVDDPKLQSLKNIALELNPSIFSKHVKRAFHTKLSANVVVPEDSLASGSSGEVDGAVEGHDSSLPKAPTNSTHLTSFRRKAKHTNSDAQSESLSSISESTSGSSTIWSKFHYFCLHLASLPAFEYFILVIVCLNCLTLAMTYRGMSASFTEILDIVEFIFTGIFLFEMLLKIISFGPYKYIVDNWFDFLVIAFSVVEMLTTYAFTAQQLPNLTVLRMFRVLRIFRALKRIKKLMQVLGMIFKSGAALRNLLIFAFVWFSAVAVVGKELFGRRELLPNANADDFDRMNFDTTMNAYELLYRVATGEAWSSLMRKFMVVKFNSDLVNLESTLVDPINTVPALIFFVSFYLFSNFILINVLVSVILENFEVSNVDRVEEYMSMLSAEDEDIRQRSKNSLDDASSSIFEWLSRQQAQELVYVRHVSLYKLNKAKRIDVILPILQTSSNPQVENNLSSAPSELANPPPSHNSPQGVLPKSPSLQRLKSLSLSQTSSSQCDSSTVQSSKSSLWKPGLLDYVRILSHTALKSSWYPYVLYGTICLSSLTLAFTPPKHEVRNHSACSKITSLCVPPYIFSLTDNDTRPTSMDVHQCRVLVHFFYGIFLQRLSDSCILFLHWLECTRLHHPCAHHH
jgi:hypothetical protein